jgi:hypothetical protein
MIQTLQLARKHSPDAMRTLVRALDHEDTRIAVTAANLLLERAWGKPRDAPPETQEQAQIDLSQLSREELDVLLKLALSGRLTTKPVDPPVEIEAKVEPQ